MDGPYASRYAEEDGSDLRLPSSAFQAGPRPTPEALASVDVHGTPL